MIKFQHKIFVIVAASFFLFSACSYKCQSNLPVYVNTSHLDNLYEEINIDGKKLGIVHIYSEYPDYKWIGDSDEGIACVDDAARAAIFYMKYSKVFNDTSSAIKAEMLIKFLLYMQADNGFFYNFILQDYSINKTHQNSVARADWWSWRALWALTEAYDFFNERNANLSEQIKTAVIKTIDSTKVKFKHEKKIVEFNGFYRPTWLPYQYASDQAALMVIGLCKYYSLFHDESILNLITDLCEGMIIMQEGSENLFPYYAFMSWENLWHAWGNSQSYSLLCAYEITHENKYLTAALNEINYFYRYLLREKFFDEFTIEKENGRIVIDSQKKFPQIAYGIRPMVYSALKASQITGDESYLTICAEAAAWFWGNNPAKTKMYSEQNGICFDGILNETEINKNSGAESTIEALLSLLSIEENKNALNKFNEIIPLKN